MLAVSETVCLAKCAKWMMYNPWLFPQDEGNFSIASGVQVVKHEEAERVPTLLGHHELNCSFFVLYFWCTLVSYLRKHYSFI